MAERHLIIEVVPYEEPEPHPLCLCFWREDLPCPNRATWRVQNVGSKGYSLMCDPHKEDFAQAVPEAWVRYEPLTDAARTPPPGRTR